MVYNVIYIYTKCRKEGHCMSSRVFDYIAQEEQRQQTTVELSASE